jgi:HSP20 family molecular chaperone IbpA
MLTKYYGKNWFDDVFDSFSRDFFYPSISNRILPVRSSEGENGDRKVRLNVAGYKKSDLNVGVLDGVVSVASSDGRFDFSFGADGYDTDSCEAKLEDGILELTIPRIKTEKAVAKKIEIT